MRLLLLFVTLVTVSLPVESRADEGGLGTQPDGSGQIAGGINIVAMPTPYHAVCVAPPVSCDVGSRYPVQAGVDCWCPVNGNEYSVGKTQ